MNQYLINKFYQKRKKRKNESEKNEKKKKKIQKKTLPLLCVAALYGSEAAKAQA
jgi:hypothetical protein